MFFFENRQQFNGPKKPTFFNARPKFNARAHLKQRKNIVALSGKRFPVSLLNKIEKGPVPVSTTR